MGPGKDPLRKGSQSSDLKAEWKLPEEEREGMHWFSFAGSEITTNSVA